jgi:hypothetical protein
MLDGKSEGGPHRDDMLHERPIDNRTGQASRDFDDEIPF